jgi:hypothetical protein
MREREREREEEEDDEEKEGRESLVILNISEKY